jgi:hypothetical protein
LPEPEVTVALSNGISTLTDADGRYTLNTPLGAMELTATKERFGAPAALSVNLTEADGTLEVNVLEMTPKHWFNQVSGVSTSLWDVHAISSDQAWVVGEDNTLLRTTDGGKDWRPAHSAPSADYRGVFFVNATTGWAVGTAGTIVKSTDGGATWVAQTSGTSESFYDVAFADASFGLAVTANAVFRTLDGGATWTPSASAGGYRIDVLNTQRAVVGGRGYLYITNSGGQTWQRGAYAGAPESVQMVSPTEIWTFDYDVVKRSRDGGITLENVCSNCSAGPGRKVSTSPERYITSLSTSTNEMYFVDALTGWRVGAGGSIQRY